MRVVIQRVSSASIVVNENEVGAIGQGLLILFGVGDCDLDDDMDWLVNKIVQLRIFSGDSGHMDKSVQDIDGEIAVVSQFTLYAISLLKNQLSFFANESYLYIGSLSRPVFALVHLSPTAIKVRM